MPSPKFQLSATAVPTDIDELGHVSNLVYLRWVQEVARSHSVAVGLDHDSYKRLECVFVVRRHEVEYLAPAYVDDVVLLTTWIERWRGASAVRETRITRNDGFELARATTLWAYVSIGNGRPRRIPPDVASAFSLVGT